MALGAVLAQNASAAVPAELLSGLIKSAALLASGKTAAMVMPAQVVALSDGIVKDMLLAKLKIVAGVILAIALACYGVGQLARVALAGRHAEDDPLGPEQAEAVSDEFTVRGIVRVEGTGAPVAGAVIGIHRGGVPSGTMAGVNTDFGKDYPGTRTIAKTGAGGNFTLNSGPGSFKWGWLIPPPGYWASNENFPEKVFDLTGVIPVVPKEFVVRSGVVWNFRLSQPVGSFSWMAQQGGKLFFANPVDENGLIRLTLPTEAGEVSMYLTGEKFATSPVANIRWESGFRTEAVKGPEGLIDVVGKKAKIGGQLSPSIEGNKLVLRIIVAGLVGNPLQGKNGLKK